MGRVSLVIGVDSGLTHLAAALDIPTIALYGPTDPFLTGIRGRHAVSLDSSYACAPCRSPVCLLIENRTSHAGTPPCFGTLNPAQVWQAATRQMSIP